MAATYQGEMAGDQKDTFGGPSYFLICALESFGARAFHHVPVEAPNRLTAECEKASSTIANVISSRGVRMAPAKRDDVYRTDQTALPAHGKVGMEECKQTME